MIYLKLTLVLGLSWMTQLGRYQTAKTIVALGISKRLQISDEVIYFDKNNSKGVILFPCLN